MDRPEEGVPAADGQVVAGDVPAVPDGPPANPMDDKKHAYMTLYDEQLHPTANWCHAIRFGVFWRMICYTSIGLDRSVIKFPLEKTRVLDGKK